MCSPYRQEEIQEQTSRESAPEQVQWVQAVRREAPWGHCESSEWARVKENEEGVPGELGWDSSQCSQAAVAGCEWWD